MKRSYKIAVTAIMILLVISLSLNIVSAVNQTAVPGSDQDPIVSKSYVDAAFEELSSKIQLLLEQNDNLKSQNAKLTTELTNQKKTIDTLKEEVAALKSGKAPAANTGSSEGSGAGGNAAQTEQTPEKTLGKAVVNVAVLNLRSQPNTSSAIVAKLVKNETVTLISKSDGWYKITTSSGKTGYVLGTLVTVK